jgi:xylan 1,4-beta-xylosidase
MPNQRTRQPAPVRLLLAVLSCPLLAAAAAAADAPVTPVERVDIDLQAAAHPLPHFWEQAFGSGRAILTLREGYRDDLRAVKAATGFGYARFHAIFHDEVGVYDEDAKGNPLYNFSYVDQIYDGLLANGVRPFVEISFMPKKLALRQDVHAFWYKQVVSPPKSYAKWDGLITAFARHLVERYGIDEVAQWYFEVWNEPNIDFWTGNPKQRTYFELYDHTARALKAVDARLRVGGPSSSSAHWVDEFLAHAAKADVPVDFVSSHGYADDTVEDLMGTHEPIPMDQRVCRAIGKVRAQIDASPRPGLPLMWTEWNVPSFGDAVQARDSAYVGAGVAETVSQCDGLVQMLSFWTFSDVFEENGPGQRPFNGSFGLMGLGGIMKPSYTAYALLHRLGGERLASGVPGALVTRRADGGFAIALWNLRDPGTPQLEREVALRLDHLPGGAHVQVTAIDDEHGSSRAAYRAMGSPRYPTRAQVAEMNKAAALPPPKPLLPGADGRVHLRLAPNALALLEVLP